MDMIGWAINPEKFLEPLQRQGGVRVVFWMLRCPRYA